MTIRFRRRPIPLLSLLLSTLLCVPAGPSAARGLALIRDAEIETTIRTYATPLFQAASLDPSAVEILIVQDPTLNSFVAGGQKIFINTGLLLAADTPNQLIGVLAHETGHISGGHLARMPEAMKNASMPALLALILGGAAVAAGAGKAAQAIIIGGESLSQQTYLQYSRAQEGAADQAAVRLLDATGQSPLGLLQFLEKLGDQELLVASSQDPYVRTHPMSTERVESLRAQVATSRYKDVKDPPKFIVMHARMQAKLFGYINGLVQTLRKYPESDTSVPARYARAIAYYRANKAEKALQILDGMLAEAPDDPYFHELKGQILLETQRVEAAIPAYARAVELQPQDGLLRLGLGQAEASSSSDAHVKDALANLKAATSMEPHNPEGWRWLATAYARDEQLPMAALATAERYVLTGHYRDALLQTSRAMKGLPQGSPGYLRAQDLESLAKQELEKQGNGRGERERGRE